MAKPVVGDDEPFGVILPDDLIWNEGPGALARWPGSPTTRTPASSRWKKCPTRTLDKYGIVTTDDAKGRAPTSTTWSKSPGPPMHRRISPWSCRYVYRAASSAAEETTPGTAARSSSPTPSIACSRVMARSWPTASRAHASIAAGGGTGRGHHSFRPEGSEDSPPRSAAVAPGRA